MPMSHYPGGFYGGVAIREMPVLNTYSRKVVWVDSNAGTTTNARGTFRNPAATISAALDLCTADKGDIIMLKANHAEAPVATVTIDVAGVSIIGLGNGTNRPTIVPAFTVASDDVLDITAADVRIQNIVIEDGTNTGGNSVQINIGASAHNVVLEDMKVEMGAVNLQCITVAATAHRGTVRNMQVVGMAANPDSFMVFEGGSDDWKIQNVDILMTAATDIDGPVFYQNAVLMENLLIDNVRVIGLKDAGLFLDFNSASTGLVSNCYVYFLGTTFGEAFDLGNLATYNVCVAGAAKKAMPYPAATLAI